MTKKTIAIGLIGVTILTALILGPMKAWSHASALFSRINTGVDDITSDAQELARIQVLLRSQERNITAYQDRLAELDAQLESDETLLSQWNRELENQRDILSQERELLKQDRAEYLIKGRNFTRQQVEEDALSRIEFAKQLSEKIDQKSKLVANLQAALDEGHNNLQKAKASRRNQVDQVKALEARLNNARALSAVAAIVEDLGSAPLGAETELSQAFSTLEKRVRIVERRSQPQSDERPFGMVINWDTEADADASEALSVYLDSVSGSPANDNDSILPDSSSALSVGEALGMNDLE